MSVGTAHIYVATVTGLLRTCAGTTWTSSSSTGPLVECGRVGDSRADYSAEHRGHDAVGLARAARPYPRPNSRAHPQDHQDLRAARRLGRRRPAYQGAGPRRPPGTPTKSTANRAPAQAPSPRRARHGTTEVLADLLQIPHQPQPDDRHRQGRPPPGEATLKTLVTPGISPRIGRLSAPWPWPGDDAWPPEAPRVCAPELRTTRGNRPSHYVVRKIRVRILSAVVSSPRALDRSPADACLMACAWSLVFFCRAIRLSVMSDAIPASLL